MTPTEAIDYLVGTLPANPALMMPGEHTEALVALRQLAGRQVEVDPVRVEALSMALLHRREGQGADEVTGCAGAYEVFLRGPDVAFVPA